MGLITSFLHHMSLHVLGIRGGTTNSLSHVHNIGTSHIPTIILELASQLAEWWLEVSCWWPKPGKQNISRHRGGQEDKRVGSKVASLWQPAGSSPCSPLAAHLEAYLCATQWTRVS